MRQAFLRYIILKLLLQVLGFLRRVLWERSPQFECHPGGISLWTLDRMKFALFSLDTLFALKNYDPSEKFGKREKEELCGGEKCGQLNNQTRSSDIIFLLSISVCLFWHPTCLCTCLPITLSIKISNRLSFFHPPSKLPFSPLFSFIYLFLSILSPWKFYVVIEISSLSNFSLFYQRKCLKFSLCCLLRIIISTLLNNFVLIKPSFPFVLLFLFVLQCLYYLFFPSIFSFVARNSL